MGSESSLRQRRIDSFTALFLVTFSLLIIGIFPDYGTAMELRYPSTRKISSVTHRKLLSNYHETDEPKEKKEGNGKMKMVEPNRIWREKCSKSDIVISQGATEPLPNGIPTYTVEIMNICLSDCQISAVHLSCGWFSSARLVNPRVFQRLHFDDCLVNDGKPLVNGRTLSFQYSNTFPYPLSVTSVTC